MLLIATCDIGILVCILVVRKLRLRDMERGDFATEAVTGLGFKPWAAWTPLLYHRASYARQQLPSEFALSKERKTHTHTLVKCQPKVAED